MRRPGIVSLHSVTTTNAMRFAYETAADDATRRWLLLQAASYLPHFRGEMAARKEQPADLRFDSLEPIAPQGTGPAAVEEIFADLSKDKTTAARKVLGYLKADPDPRPLTDAARRLIFRKGSDSHDYKFSSAVLEDAEFISPEWRNRFLAASLFWMKGAGAPDSPLVKRTHAALA
jgi:hypothetical protein